MGTYLSVSFFMKPLLTHALAQSLAFALAHTRGHSLSQLFLDLWPDLPSSVFWPAIPGWNFLTCFFQFCPTSSKECIFSIVCFLYCFGRVVWRKKIDTDSDL